MAVSQKGYDVKTCADRFLAYSSAFEGLKIFSKTNIFLDGVAGTINHNLGYYAPFIVFNSDGSIYCFDCKQYTDRLVLNEDNENTVTLTVFIFENDFSDISGVNINTGTSYGTSSQDYGMRVSKQGYDVKTCTEDQLVFSSSYFTNIIHQKGSFRPGPDNGYGASDTPGSVSHNLSYVPDFFMYIKYDSDSYIKPMVNQYDGNIAQVSATDLEAAIVYDFSLSWYRIDTLFYYIIFKNKVI